MKEVAVENLFSEEENCFCYVEGAKGKLEYSLTEVEEGASHFDYDLEGEVADDPLNLTLDFESLAVADLFRDPTDQNEAVEEARGHDHYGLVEVEEPLPQFGFSKMIYNYYTV